MAWARSPREVAMVMQRRCMDSAGPRTIMPHDPAYAEVARLDPQGDGTAWCEMRHGVAVRLSPRVLRVTSPGTPGHNAYLVGGEQIGWIAIDPGPADGNHIEALIEAAPGRIRSILLTGDGARAGADRLAERTGVQVQDPGTGAGRAIGLGDDITVRVVNDPQGSAQRVRYLLVEEKTLFPGTASHPPGPPSLSLEDLEWIAPGQGFLIPVP